DDGYGCASRVSGALSGGGLMLAVWAVDPNRVRRGQLQALECTVVVRDADVGTFTLTVPDDELSGRMRDGWRVLIQDGGQTILSGAIVEVAPNVVVRPVEFTGVTDFVHVAALLVYPNPALPGDSQPDDAFYRRSGPAEPVIRDMVHENAGGGAISVRRADGFAVEASQARGSTVS